jgi:2-methylcitrate dehydratase PrpD
VKAVRARIGVAQASMLRNHDPVTGLEAKFSLEFAVASALVAGRVGLSELTDPFVARADVRQIMPRVSIETTDTQCPIEPVFAYSDRVELVMHDGAVLDSGDIRFARGNALAPLGDADLRMKFMDCTASAQDIDSAELYGRLTDLQSVTSVAALTRRQTAHA